MRYVYFRKGPLASAQSLPDEMRVAPGHGIDAIGALEADSKDDAIAQVTRWATPGLRAGDQADEQAGDHAGKEGTIELRESGCPGGLAGIVPSASAAPKSPRFLVLLKSDVALEADAPTDPDRIAAMARRNDADTAAGVLRAGEGLKGSAKGARVTFASGKTRVIDGPFAETKELVAGYWVIEVPTMAAAVEWVRDYPFAPLAPEVEILPLLA